jgi:polyribonucleotide nucleotidyltransferase
MAIPEVLSTCLVSQEEKNLDFFPLTVEYQERYYAAGKILGSRFIRRELRPSDEAICTARLIDRTIRPLFPKDFKREVEVIVTCLAWDGENDPDIPAILATSVALLLSDIPWDGPVAPLRIGKNNSNEEGEIKDEFVLNPTYSQREKSNFDLVVVGVKEKDEFLINMIEAEAQEVTEEEIIRAIDFSKEFFKTLIEIQEKIRGEFGKEKIKIENEVVGSSFENELKNFLKEKVVPIVYETDALKREEMLKELDEEIVDFVSKNFPDQIDEKSLLSKIKWEEFQIAYREKILKEGIRIDGRKLDEIRPIETEAGVIKRAHGSGFFSRGQTKVLSILTLGAPGDVKLLEGMEFIGKKRFLHHYNFPPYSSGEIKPLRGPSRREIGHGMLVEKALLPVIPSFEEFPYSMRIVSEVLSSNGSTSMASVSASSLALMDGGVPIKKPVGGISIGLVTQKDDYKLLTDIEGSEDHFGDMDFKVAGTEEGITAIQMDIKIRGINDEVLKNALERAKLARLEVLRKIKEVLEKPREKLSPFAPIIKTLKVKPEKIGEIIGPKGKQINEIIEKCEVSIDIEPTGQIYITAEKEEGADKAIEWIKNITREVKEGETFNGRVVRIVDFGIFVEIFPGQVGLVHISNLVPYRIKNPSEVVKVGDLIPVKIISIDELGRINLSAIEAGFKPKRVPQVQKRVVGIKKKRGLSYKTKYERRRT